MCHLPFTYEGVVYDECAPPEQERFGMNILVKRKNIEFKIVDFPELGLPIIPIETSSI